MYDMRSSVVVVGNVPVFVSCACNCVGLSVLGREGCSIYTGFDFFFKGKALCVQSDLQLSVVYSHCLQLCVEPTTVYCLYTSRQ
jgi:hypothetical protein